MSAGKGDTPRPCNGDAYRAGYDRIFQKPTPAMSENDFPQPAYNTRPVDPHRGADAAERCVRCLRRIASDDTAPKGLCDDCEYEDRMTLQDWKEELWKGQEE